MIMNEELLTNKNILTYEYYTGDLLDYKPSRAFVFFAHDNGYSLESMDFDKLHDFTEKLDENRIIAVGKGRLFTFKRDVVDKYLQELVNDEGVEADEVYLQLPNGKWVEYKNESHR